ncbi:helix-turn-helix transcriptional regulator [Desulfurispira natronophila]|uniref:Putative DNA-binding transcriptional regulator YafY n=1 Tax=Desulfurispira natronophila TaxID=682562 RepID=A0A7W7Y3A9_9BACT|nr:WYL domain-containing transcriptional regulator [Desulfurispira natronophila]MBB5021292.1 putative DNA-binding transcriptional regulator YafY [Desulfurispira natronophila]
MSDTRALEHYSWFHQQARQRFYPNATTLAAQFEISTRTAQRRIETIRDRFGAPLEYDHQHKGYFYTDHSYQLPPLWLSQNELLCWLIARNMLESATAGHASQALAAFETRLFRENSIHPLNPQQLRNLFSSQYTSLAPCNPDIFNAITQALLLQRILTIDYHSPQDNQQSTRTIEPHHLFHYHGSWVLVAWCHLRHQWRQFHLSRMQQATMEATTFTPQPKERWQALVNQAYGLFQGTQTIVVRLRFSPKTSRWIREQQWHPDQHMNLIEHGAVEISFPVADLREIKMRVLSYGAEVEVLEPKELRDMILAEAKKMVKESE